MAQIKVCNGMTLFKDLVINFYFLFIAGMNDVATLGVND